MAGTQQVRALLSPADRIAWLRLIRTENVGPATFRTLINRFGSAQAALDALPGLVNKAGRKAPLNTPSISAMEDEIASTQALGGTFVGIGEPDYPDLLRHIHGPPPMLAMLGNPKRDWSRSVGIVGARNASAAGQRFTSLIAGELGENGYLVVSGLARGVDAAAHRASLQTGTIAVVAGGFSHIYPEQNIPLAHDIVAAGGAIVTEMPLDWEPRAKDFPRRNRLVSGLSLGVLVVEAAKRSGSLITARLALEQNREVFAVPGSPLDPRAQGTNDLIRQGATLVSSAQDIISVLDSADPNRLPLFEAEDDDFPLPLEIDPMDEPNGDQRAQLIDALSPTPIAVDVIIQQSGLSAGAVQILLLELELAGRLERSSGQLVALRS